MDGWINNLSTLIMRYFVSLLAAALAFALPQSAPSVQYENITIYATDPHFQYAPSCGPISSTDWPGCPGGWSRYYDERFSNGVAMIATEPASSGNALYPYVAFKFRGEILQCV